jgi:hypothetical protein
VGGPTQLARRAAASRSTREPAGTYSGSSARQLDAGSGLARQISKPDPERIPGRLAGRCPTSHPPVHLRQLRVCGANMRSSSSPSSERAASADWKRLPSGARSCCSPTSTPPSDWSWS